MRRMLLCTFCTASLICHSTGQLARTVELPDKFVDEYAEATQNLKQAYTRATISGKYTLEFPTAGGLARTLDFVYRVDGPHVRLDESNVQHFDEDGRPSGDRYACLWLTGGSQSGFAYEPSGDEPVEFHSYDSQKIAAHGQSTTLVNWVYGYQTLQDFEPSSDITVTSHEEAIVDGRPIVAIGCKWTTAHNGPTVFWTGRYLLSPSEGWAVRECAWTSRADDWVGQFRLCIQYDGMRNGVARVKRIVEEYGHSPNEDVMQRRTVEFTSVELGAPEPGAFTTSACEGWLREQAASRANAE